MSGPLDGYRVIELTSTVSGPFAGMMMADQGADVIKVEPPLIGDLARVMGSSRDGMAAMFSVINRNKRCIVLDFKEPKDFDVLKMYPLKIIKLNVKAKKQGFHFFATLESSKRKQ